jgi:translation elongation factor EF-Tu-like GTPase
MKELVMKVDKFFNITERQGIVYTVLGGILECDLKNGEMVTIEPPGTPLQNGGPLTTDIAGIKRYAEDLKEAKKGETVGLSFFGIHHMGFRLTEPLVNPYNPRENLEAYLAWNSKEHDAEETYIYREQKPTFLFLHGEGYD